MKNKILLILMVLVAKNVLAQQPRLVVPVGHTSGVSDALFSPNGKYIVSKSEQGLIVWDVETGRLLRSLTKNQVIGNDVFVHNSEWIITYSEFSKRATQVHNLATGKFLFDLPGVLTDLNDKQDFALIGTGKGKIEFWDFNQKKALYKFNGNWAEFLSDNDYFFIETDAKGIRKESNFITIYESKTGKKIASYKGTVSGFSKRYICIETDSLTNLYNFISGELRESFLRPKIGFGFKGYISYTEKFSKDEKYMVSFEVEGRGNYGVLYDVEGDSTLRLLNYGDYTDVNDIIFDSKSKFMLAITEDSVAVCVRIQTNDTLFHLKGHSGEINCITYSPNEKYLVTSSEDKSVILWDSKTGEKLRTFEGNNDRPSGFTNSEDGKYFGFYYQNNLLVYDAAMVNKFLSLKMPQKADIHFSTDNRAILIQELFYTGHGGPFLCKIDILTGKTMYFLSNELDSTNDKYIMSENGAIYARERRNGMILFYTDRNEKVAEIDTFARHTIKHIEISTQNEYCIVLYNVVDENRPSYYKFIKYDIHKGAVIWTVHCPISIREFKLNEKMGKLICRTGYGQLDNDLLYVSLVDGSIRTESKNKNNISEIDGFSYSENSIKISPSATLFSIKSGNILRVYDLKTGKILLKVVAASQILNCEFVNDNKIVFGQGNGPMEVWNINERIIISKMNTLNKWFVGKTGTNYIIADPLYRNYYDSSFNIICSFINLEVNEIVVKLENGFYKSAPAASKKLYYVNPDLKVITFEQLDVKYNRPDLVLKAIGNTDSNLINSYKKAYDKRIKKLGIDTTQFADNYSVPEADFVNRDAVEYEQKNGALILKIHGTDSTYLLDRFNIWVNEIPLFGQRGISLRSRNTNTLDTTISISLSSGENRIETSILNVNGTESYRMPLMVKYVPDKKENSKVHFIGIGMDRFNDMSFNLQYSSKDIRDMAAALRKRYGDTLIIDTLFNQIVTAKNIAALKTKLLQTGVNDKVIVAYSGHGLLSKDYDYYLSTYTVDFNHPEKGGLPYEALESLLDSIPARQKLMLIDACHSGEVDKDEIKNIKAIAGAKGVTVTSSKPTNTKTIGLSNSFELMQELFVNVSKGTGATVISASGGLQFALENDTLKNGVFTYAILEAMINHKSMTVSVLKAQVGKRVTELTNGQQKPTSRNETINSDWRVW